MIAKWLITTLTLLALGSIVASAAPLLTVQSGGITLGAVNLGTAGTAAAPWTFSETMTAPGILSLTDTDGTPLQSPSGVPPFGSGSWFQKTVTNNTGTPWTSFELELQQILGTPSGEGDGLSFAQQSGLAFTSDVFTTLTRIDITRDYLNFSGGTVAPGGTVTFTFAVTDNSPTSPIYLMQTPNISDIPEPSTFGLIGVALIGLAVRLKRMAE